MRVNESPVAFDADVGVRHPSPPRSGSGQVNGGGHPLPVALPARTVADTWHTRHIMRGSRRKSLWHKRWARNAPPCQAEHPSCSIVTTGAMETISGPARTRVGPLAGDGGFLPGITWRAIPSAPVTGGRADGTRRHLHAVIRSLASPTRLPPTDRASPWSGRPGRESPPGTRPGCSPGGGPSWRRRWRSASWGRRSPRIRSPGCSPYPGSCPRMRTTGIRVLSAVFKHPSPTPRSIAATTAAVKEGANAGRRRPEFVTRNPRVATGLWPHLSTRGPAKSSTTPQVRKREKTRVRDRPCRYGAGPSALRRRGQ